MDKFERPGGLSSLRDGAVPSPPKASIPDATFMTSLTREEINEIERRKREENNARAKALWGCAATTKHPRLS